MRGRTLLAGVCFIAVFIILLVIAVTEGGAFVPAAIIAALAGAVCFISAIIDDQRKKRLPGKRYEQLKKETAEKLKDCYINENTGTLVNYAIYSDFCRKAEKLGVPFETYTKDWGTL